jgi:protein-S-isoprenylcysteine O-methyltransferase Ste14
MTGLLAQYRVPIGFACAVVAFWFAQPTAASLRLGLAIALFGEAIRIWAAGHLEKGTEITTSGPYQFVRHPLYLGSALMGVALIVAAQHPGVALLVGAYLGLALPAAIRTEESVLDRRFGGAYAAYRAGANRRSGRRFSLARVKANREYRAVAGLAIGMAVLWWRAGQVG